MIDQRCIDSAVNIRTDFNEISGKLETLAGDLSKTQEKIGDTVERLQEIASNLIDYDTKDEVQKEVIEELVKLEEEGKRIEKIYIPLNEKIEKLQREEELLYKNIKDKYKNLSDIEIVDILRKEFIKKRIA